MSLFCVCLLINFLFAAKFPFQNPNLPTEIRVEDLISRLTLDEKVRQMTDIALPIDRLGIPEYNWWNEALHGVARASAATVFPQAVGLGATFDNDTLFDMFTIVSDEARAKYNEFQRLEEYGRYKGLTFWTPNINIFRDPRWGRGQETYGEDPYLTSRMGVSAVKGLQGNDPKYKKLHACAKHFAVHSGPESTRNIADVHPTNRDLYTTYVYAFEALVKEADVREVMCAYNAVNGHPACDSDLLFKILRGRWNYTGLVTSDCWAINDFLDYNDVFQTPSHGAYPDMKTATVAALRTGTDLDCGSTSYPFLADAVREGMVAEEELDVSLRRLFRGRVELGMFDEPAALPWSSLPISLVESEANLALARLVAQKSIVLLKNGLGGDSTPTLPLKKTLAKVSVIGPNANSTDMLVGNYNGIGTHNVTVLDGVKKALGDSVTVNFEAGSDLVVANASLDAVDYEGVAARAADSDVIIFVGGISAQLEGEDGDVNSQLEGFNGGDRVAIELPQVQRNMLTHLKATGKPVVLVVCAGSAISLVPENTTLDAILYAWYPGEVGGLAVADVLFGDYNPGGRLPVTIYKNVSQLPDFEDYNMTNRTYRYLKEEPLYPFGYGLSYTTFTWANAKLSATTFPATDESVVFSVDVTNDGGVAGDEVVQVYVKYPQNPLEPVKTLKGFKRVSIAAGVTATVQIPLPPSSFATYDESILGLAVKPGSYAILYGKSSRNADLKEIPVTLV